MNIENRLIWSASPTPFLSDGALDAQGIRNLVEQHARLGVTGLFLGGSCGEGPYMPASQLADLVEQAALAADGRFPIAAQVSDTSAARVCENMRRMRDAGAQVLVMAPPWIASFATPRFLRRYFMESLNQAPLPVGVYLIAGSVWDLDLLREMARHPKVYLVKDSLRSVDARRVLLEVKADRPELRLMTGYEFDVLSDVAAGYDGCLVGTGILNAGMIRRALESLDAGDRAAADVWQKRSNGLLYDLFDRDLGRWLGGLKYALVRMGIFTTDFMHLSFPLAASDRQRVDSALEREREWIGLPSPVPVARGALPLHST